MVDTLRDDLDHPLFPAGDPPRLDADPLLARLRREPGMRRVRLPYGRATWLAVRHRDVKALLTDQRFSRADAVGPDEPRILPFIQQANVLLVTDAPEHDRLRQLLAGAFTVRGVERLRPFTERTVEELLDAMRQQEAPVDLLAAYALPLPALVIAELLGVPAAERQAFRRLADAFSVPAVFTRTVEELMAQREELQTYLSQLIERKRASPGDDLLSSLIDGGSLTADELLAVAFMLLVAGHEATADQIANLTYLLLTHPDQRRELLDRPEQLPAAVEEMLRFVPSGVATGLPRLATEDVRLGGVLVRRGEFVMPLMAGANRDEEVFADPDRLDFTRPRPAHFAFGHGVHRCLGAALARMELQVAIGALLRRFPDLRLAADVDDIIWCAGGLVRAPVNLPVAW
jgi:cytochrome P450